MSTMQKLRTIAILGHQKIHLRRKDNRPGKWPEKGFNDKGERDWLMCTLSFLADKLQEECLELVKAAASEGFDETRKEAGDVTNIAMMIADHTGALPLDALAPKVVCLCGSTRFKDQFMKAQFEETMKGSIVLSVGFFHHSDKTYVLSDAEKIGLDALHKRKIDLADEILVINVDGYIGDSTRSEIQYARDTGKPVRYIQIPND